MRNLVMILVLICWQPFDICAQDVPATTQQQLENNANAEHGETEDDSYLQELEQFRKHPIDINTAGENELRELKIITDLQISNLLSYRNLLGKFISIYELQAVPAWDISTIKKVLPYITISPGESVKKEFIKRFTGGEHSMLLRVSQVLEKSKGFDNSLPGTKYLGSPQRMFFRYNYRYKNLLQFGLVGDKDAGEQFFKGAQRMGFDFYSLHFFARKIGIIQSVAIGDYTVNMGQGLIQWQGLAFRKSADVMGVERQSTILRPYNSAGEFYFHRGAGITIQSGKIQSTLFASFCQLNANAIIDTLTNEERISSFLVSGYNRSYSETDDKNRLTQISIGGNLSYHARKGEIGLNGIHYKFSVPLQKQDEPYNLYAIKGKEWYNLSIDYKYTLRNMHVFGEVATDKLLNKAIINGLLISVDPRVDVSLLHRKISKGFQSMYSNAFTENTNPVNENGLYMGISIRPANEWRIDMYADLYTFPWLKYQADAPGKGKDLLMQVTYSPNRQLEIYSRFRTETKSSNQPDNSTVSNFLVDIPRKSWRTQMSFRINPSLTLRNRVELIWYGSKDSAPESGFLGFADFIYKPLLKHFSGVLRLQYFETGGYNSTIYAYENDVLYSYSIPGFSGKGFRYYLNASADISKKFRFWLRWAQTIVPGGNTIGSGLDEIAGNHRSELKFQIQWLLSN